MWAALLNFEKARSTLHPPSSTLHTCTRHSQPDTTLRSPSTVHPTNTSHLTPHTLTPHFEKAHGSDQSFLAAFRRAVSGTFPSYHPYNKEVPRLPPRRLGHVP